MHPTISSRVMSVVFSMRKKTKLDATVLQGIFYIFVSRKKLKKKILDKEKTLWYNLVPPGSRGDFTREFAFVKGFFRIKAKKSEPPKWLALRYLLRHHKGGYTPYAEGFVSTFSLDGTNIVSFFVLLNYFNDSVFQNTAFALSSRVFAFFEEGDLFDVRAYGELGQDCFHAFNLAE